MRPTKTALRGALALCALLSIAACESPGQTRTQLVEVGVPVLIPIPIERISHIDLPQLPAGQMINGELVEQIDSLENLIQRCNIDRQWIRTQQVRAR